MRHSSQTLRRSAAILCASGLAMSGLLLSAPTAFGADAIHAAEGSGSDVAKINPDTQTKLIINKYGGDKCTKGAAGTGVHQNPAEAQNCPPLDGIVFSVTPVMVKGDGTADHPDRQLDLSKAADWNLIEDLSQDDFLGDKGVWKGDAESTELTIGSTTFKLGTEKPLDATDANGQAFFTPDGTTYLKDGFYLVREKSTGNHNITDRMDGFLVTLPLAHKDTKGTAETTDDTWEWLYEVEVDPKNTSKPATKKLAKVVAEDSSSVTQEWTLTVPAPALSEKATKFTAFTITDTLPSVFSKAAKDNSVTAVTYYKAGASEATTATKDTDYTVETDDTAGTVTVAFKEATANLIASGKDVTVTLQTKLDKSLLTKPTDGAYTNKMTFSTTDDKGGTTGGGGNPIPGKSNVGSAELLKYEAGKDSASADAQLPDASFRLYVPNNDANDDISKDVAITQASQCGTGYTAATARDMGEFTTGNNGKVVLKGTIDADGTKKSINACIQETAAPGGYALDKTPKMVTLTVQGDDYTSASIEVTNTKKDTVSNLVHLPLTGAAGQLVLMIAGVALIGGGALWLVAARRRRNEDA